MNRSLGIGVAVTAVALLLVGCTPPAEAEPTESSTAAPAPTPTETAPPLPSYPQPKKFDPDGVPLEIPALVEDAEDGILDQFALRGPRIVGVADSSIVAADPTTGDILWQTEIPSSPTGLSIPAGPPRSNEDGTVLYAPTGVSLPASEDRPGGEGIALIALDAATGQILWQAGAPLDLSGSRVSGREVSVSAVHGDTAVISRWGDGIADEGMTAAIDLESGSVRWSAPGTAAAVTGDTVVAVADPGETGYPQLTGWDLGSGDLLWTGIDETTALVEATAVTLADGTVLATTRSYSGSITATVVIDPRTGFHNRSVYGMDVTDPLVDGSILYLRTVSSIAAYDATTLAQLWKLPAFNRPAPLQPVYYAGLVYGGANDGGLILEGLTGVDLTSTSDPYTGEVTTARIPGTFLDVNSYGALMVRGDVVFAAATG